MFVLRSIILTIYKEDLFKISKIEFPRLVVLHQSSVISGGGHYSCGGSVVVVELLLLEDCCVGVILRQ